MSRLSVEIGQRLRNYRINQKMSQETLADKCGLHPTYIGQLERGEKNATIESIVKISSALSVPLSTLFENIDDIKPNNTNYPAQAYEIVQSASESTQKKLVSVLKIISDIG